MERETQLSAELKENEDVKVEQQALFWSQFFEALHRAQACAHGMQATMEGPSQELTVATHKLREAEWWFRDAMGWGFDRRAEQVLLRRMRFAQPQGDAKP